MLWYVACCAILTLWNINTYLAKFCNRWQEKPGKKGKGMNLTFADDTLLYYTWSTKRYFNIVPRFWASLCLVSVCSCHRYGDVLQCNGKTHFHLLPYSLSNTCQMLQCNSLRKQNYCFHLLNCQRMDNLWSASAQAKLLEVIMVCLLLLIIYLPFLNEIMVNSCKDLCTALVT